MTFLLAVMLGQLLAPQGLTLDAGVRAEGRGASAAVEAGPATRLVQLDLAAGTTFTSGQWNLAAGYTPRLLVNRPGGAGTDNSEILHGARLHAGYRLSALQQISFDQGLSYGQQDFSPLVTAPAGPSALPPDPRLAALAPLAYLSSTSALAYQQVISPRLSGGARVSWMVAGGADAKARESLPLQRTLAATGDLGWAVTRIDRLTLRTSAQASNLSNGRRAELFSSSLGWTGTLARNLLGEASAGGGATRDSQTGWSPTVTASAGLIQSVLLEGSRLTGALRGQVTSVIDPLTGGPSQLAQGTAAIDYAPTRDLGLRLSASAVRALNGDARAALNSVDLAAVFSLGHGVALAGGVRATFQRQLSVPGAPAPQDQQRAIYASISIAGRERL